MPRGLKITLLTTVLGHALLAQWPGHFETAIVRPSGPSSTFESTLTPSQFVARRHTLQMLIQSSYPDLPPWRISGGPSWVNAELWDFVAKLPPGAPADQEASYRATEQMLRNFLTDEFRLKTHFEKKEQPIYELVVAKGGTKLKPSEGGPASGRVTSRGLEIRHQTMQEFASALFCLTCTRQAADRLVIDNTGLNGYYDLTLNWSPSNIQSNAIDAGPSIFTALEEQLGLKLQPTKASVDFLVIDQAERPAGN